MLACAFLLTFMPRSAHASDCETILSTRQPFIMRGTTFAMIGTASRSATASFLVTRGDETKIVQMIGPQNDPVVEQWFKGVWPMRMTVLKTQETTTFEYALLEDDLKPGAELHYTRVLKKNGEILSAETGVAHVGEAGTRMIGDCAVDVIEIKSETRSDKAPTRASSLLFAPKLGYFVKSEQAGLGPKGDIATTFSATSLELAP
ncbi:MAG: hypothetical protein ACHQAY_09655 [Hyphomicrobiales bacterium]